jgi:hypothetical protein
MAAHRSPELRSNASAILFDFDPVLITDFLTYFPVRTRISGNLTGGALYTILAPDPGAGSRQEYPQ